MKTIAILLLLLTGSTEPSRCALLETNHYYDDDAKLVLVQVIAWDVHKDGCFRCEGWVLKTQDNYARQSRGGFITTICGRDVWAPIKRTTFSQYDPEQADQKFHDKSRRRFERMR